MNKKNVIWIYVDSVRRYHSSKEEIEAGDDRSRLLFMDEFANESIEFLNTVTSAPSTQISISAMAAAMPSHLAHRCQLVRWQRQCPHILLHKNLETILQEII